MYVVAGCRPWNRRVFEAVISKYPGRWHFIGKREELSLNTMRTLNPDYIFFLHWSWKVPDEIIREYRCVCFHMADVPYGRGGSPLQNLILLGHRHTKLTALRMTAEMDAGPVYLKEELCLEGSCAEEIYVRATCKSADMIKRIVSEDLDPVAQAGEAVLFTRRRPEESEIPTLENLQQVYDFIRMLDAEEYPRAFFQYRGFRYEMSRATLYSGRIEANVTITPLEETES